MPNWRNVITFGRNVANVLEECANEWNGNVLNNDRKSVVFEQVEIFLDGRRELVGSVKDVYFS